MISGYTVTRDCVLHDYCFEECIRSMLPFCDEVVVGDAMSEDGTRERALALSDKVRIVDYPRQDVFDQKDFVAKWVDFTRGHLRGDYQFYLDADEVAGDTVGSALSLGRKHGRSLWFKRLNFIVDTTKLIPHGLVCAPRVVRAGPTSMYMPMDCPGLDPRDGDWAKIEATSGADIFHYGFLREKSAYYRKCRFFQPALIGCHDSRLTEAEETGKPWTDLITFDVPFGRYSGNHPQTAIPWLKQRGYNP